MHELLFPFLLDNDHTGLRSGNGNISLGFFNGKRRLHSRIIL